MSLSSSIGAIAVVVLVGIALARLQPALLPHGPAVPWKPKIAYSQVDPGNVSLLRNGGRLRKIVAARFEDDGDENILHGPESVVLDRDGNVFVMTERSKLLMLSDLRPQVGDDVDTAKEEESSDTKTTTTKILLAKVTVVRDSLGSGRPLGGAFTNDGSNYLYMCDAHLGLIRLRDPLNDPRSKIEIVATTAPAEPGTADSSSSSTTLMTPIRYANDVAIGTRTGRVYFTDSTDVSPDLYDGKWDTLFASKVELLRGKAAGRLLAYDPETDAVSTLATGLKFANGVAVDDDETLLLVGETFGIKLHAYHLDGPRKGEMDVVLDSKDMVGYVDGSGCATGGDKNDDFKCYAAVVSAIVPIHKLLLKLPHPIDMWLRTLILMLPRSLFPKTKKYGGVVEVTLDRSTKQLKSFRYLQDPDGRDASSISGVAYRDGELYLGTLTNDYIAVYDVSS